MGSSCSSSPALLLSKRGGGELTSLDAKKACPDSGQAFFSSRLGGVVHLSLWSPELLERSLQVGEHARDPPVRLDNLAIREDVLLREAVAGMVIQVQPLGLLAKRDVPTRLPSLGTKLLETNVLVLVRQLSLPECRW